MSTHGRRHLDRYGNPKGLARYLLHLEDADRASWQKPDRVVRALHLGRGEVVLDVGAGPGYFALRFAKAVGPRGQVFAAEAEPRILEVLRDRVAKAGVRNVTPVLAAADNPLVPDASCDLAFVANVYHHLSERAGYLRRLRRKLRARGRIAIVDFREGQLPVGPPPNERVPHATLLAEAKRAGLLLAEELDFLPYHHFAVFRFRA